VKINVLGGGPSGLYAALLLKKNHPGWEIAVAERNPAGATYGWGVVFSDQTLTAFREADYKTYADITESFVQWDAIDIHVDGQLIRCGGHIFAGLARRRLLGILQRRCAELGVVLRFQTEVDEPDELAQADLLIAADGVNSKVRARHAGDFRPSLVEGHARYIWFGTDKLLDAFTFIFRENEHGLFQVHAYPFDGTTATFIVECSEETWRRAGLDQADEAASLAYCEALFADHLRGRRLMSNYSRWLHFVTVKNARWSHENIVLLGDAAHTAHFSIGSGTKLAMEDSIALAQAFERHATIAAALREYEQARKPRVEALQQAAAESQAYFEHTSRYQHFQPLQRAFHLLTRSGRITYDNLRQRDPYFVGDVDRWFAQTGDDERRTTDERRMTNDDQRVATGYQTGDDGRPTNDDRRMTNDDQQVATDYGPNLRHLLAPPPIWAPLALRGVTLPNRIVLTPPPADSAADGLPDQRAADQLIQRAQAGAGLVVSGPVAVSAAGRITPGCVGMYRAEHADAWARVVEAIRARSDAKIAVQLSHAGRRGATRPRSRGLDLPLRAGAWPLLAPTAIAFAPGGQVPQAMDCADMERVRDEFARAARLADRAGFDMLQLNMAHGYLLASFLSPLANRREDGYGGELANRMRYPLEVFDAARAAWPAEKPLAVALNADDWAPGGLDLADAVAIGCALRERGCDLIAVYAGQATSRSQPSYDAGTLAQYSDVLRNEARIPTLATGYMTVADQGNTLLAGGRADLCLFHLLDLM
jgi:anthraniloyl-CoA monooxygenase